MGIETNPEDKTVMQNLGGSTSDKDKPCAPARDATSLSGPQFAIHPVDRHLLASVPWSLVLPHEKQAIRNHCQTLERLAQRGGLSIIELYYVLRNESLRYPFVPQAHALAYVRQRMELAATPPNSVSSDVEPPDFAGGNPS